MTVPENDQKTSDLTGFERQTTQHNVSNDYEMDTHDRKKVTGMPGMQSSDMDDHNKFIRIQMNKHFK